MARISATLTLALAAAAGVVSAQTQPSMVLGTDIAGIYSLYTPAGVVAAAGGGTTPLSNATPQAESGSGAAGTADDASRGDHVHPARTGPTTPLSDTTPLIAGTGAAGSADDASRGDHVHPAQAVPVPSTAAPPAVASRGAAGTSALYARQDHTHRGDGAGTLSNANPKIEGTAAPGSSGSASRGDHVHPSFTPPLSAYGTVGTAGTCAKANTARTGLAYGDCGSPRVLSERDPLAPGTADPGNRTQVSRDDHVHPAQAVPSPETATPKAPGTAAAGSASAYSRGDHVHPAQAVPSPETATPKAPGTAAAGSASAYSRGDHVHPDEIPSLAGNAQKCLRVNASATGLQFGSCTTEGTGGGIGVTRRVDTNQAGSLTWNPGNIPVIGVEANADNRMHLIFTPARNASTSIAAWDNQSRNRYECNVKRSSTNVWSLGNQLNCSRIQIWELEALAPDDVVLPNPTAGVAGQYLRVAAAGGAFVVYDLAADISHLEDDANDAISAIDALHRVTQDLSVAREETPWANSTVSGAGIAIRPCSLTHAPALGYTVTIARPQDGWPSGQCIYARLPAGADVTTYRVLEPAGGTVTLVDPGGSWGTRPVATPDSAHDYYLVNTVSVDDGTLALQHGGAIERTTFHGHVADATAGLPPIPGDTASKDYALQTKEDGSGVEWSNEAFSSLMANAQDIGEALERIGHLDKPSDAQASSSTLAAGQEWRIVNCNDTAGSRACTAGWGAASHTVRTLAAHGTGAPNATTASFAPTGRLTQHALISGTSYDAFIVVARHVAGNPTVTHIRSCAIPGVQGDWLANAAHAVRLISESGACTLTAPATGNLTVTWAAPLAGQKILGDSWRLYGVDW